MQLIEFINEERQAILAEWDSFARTLLPAAGGMDVTALRDHADEILTAIVEDMSSMQSPGEQAAKAAGQGEARNLHGVGKLHAELRIEAGFELEQMVAEYRALRASVLRLWDGPDCEGVMRFNEAIDEALTEAVRSFAAKTAQFRDESLGILSHDLRNPLGGIISGAELLTLADGIDQQSAEIGRRILSSASRMNRMVDDLLDLTRTRFGQQIPLAIAATDLAPLCQQVVSELQSQRAPGALECTSQGDLRGEWDGDRIAQMLSNLVANALQHGGSERVSIVAREAGDQVLLEVHNGGRPIPSSALHTIFEPMVRHAPGPEQSRGLGLGLYIASQIALAHGGHIDVASTEAEGTTFTVQLPRRTARGS